MTSNEIVTKFRKRIRWGERLLALCCLTAAILVYRGASGSSGSGEEAPLTVTFLDIGQGDAILLQTPDGCALIDAGPDAGQETLLASLSSRGITAVDLMFVTHGDSDHAGGADAAVRALAVKKLFLPDTGASSPSVRALKAAAREAGTDIGSCGAGDRFYLREVCFEILSPFFPLAGEENTDSLVISVTCGSCRLLLCGDADTAAEERVLAAVPGERLRCDLVKVGHHGSRTSSSEEWLRALSPAVAVISCGRANTFGHPHAEILSRLSSLGIAVLRTDLEGDLCFVCDGSTVQRKPAGQP